MILREEEQNILEQVPDGLSLQRIPYLQRIDGKIKDCFLAFVFEKREDGIYKQPVGYYTCDENGNVNGVFFDEDVAWVKGDRLSVERELLDEYHIRYEKIRPFAFFEELTRDQKELLVEFKDCFSSLPEELKKIAEKYFIQMIKWIQ